MSLNIDQLWMLILWEEGMMIYEYLFLTENLEYEDVNDFYGFLTFQPILSKVILKHDSYQKGKDLQNILSSFILARRHFIVISLDAFLILYHYRLIVLHLFIFRTRNERWGDSPHLSNNHRCNSTCSIAIQSVMTIVLNDALNWHICRMLTY